MPRVRVIKVPADTPPPEKSSSKNEDTPKEDEPVQEVFEQQSEPIKSEEVASNRAQDPRMAVESSLVREGIMLTKKALIIIVLTVALLLLVVYAIGHRQSVGSKDSSKTSEQSTGESEAIRYEQELSKIVDLPQGKTPTFSTVDDAQKLAAKSPTLFKNAQNGDIFLVYLNEDKTGKVVLYRPSTKKVILFIDGVDLGQQTTGTNSQKQ